MICPTFGALENHKQIYVYCHFSFLLIRLSSVVLRHIHYMTQHKTTQHDTTQNDTKWNSTLLIFHF